MVARALRDATLGVLTLSAFAFAQDPATPPANPPATPPAATPPAAPPQTPAGMPRHRSAVKLGDANVVIEHGQPPWSDDRIGQMAQLPPGSAWRMGAENLTTFVVTGAPVFFGDDLIRPGRYGFNLLHVADNAWNFIVYEPTREAQSPFQMVGDEPNHPIASKFVGDAAESVAALTIDVTADGDRATCELKWGPMRVSAPITAVNIAQSELELNGAPAVASWYSRPLRADADCTQPTIAGAIEYEVDGESCSMNVYVMHDGDKLVTLFRNQEREKWERENAGMDEQVKRLEAAIQQFGAQAEAQINPILAQMRRKRAKNEVLLEDSVTRPDNIKFSAAAEAASPGSLSCDVVKLRSSSNLEVIFGGKKALIRLDEAQFTPKASG